MNDYIQVRISKATKIDFQEYALQRGETVSEILRKTITKNVNDFKNSI